MKIDVDFENHQWVINYKGIIREVSFFSEVTDELINEMKKEYRDKQLKKILRKV